MESGGRWCPAQVGGRRRRCRRRVDGENNRTGNLGRWHGGAQDDRRRSAHRHGRAHQAGQGAMIAGIGIVMRVQVGGRKQRPAADGDTGQQHHGAPQAPRAACHRQDVLPLDRHAVRITCLNCYLITRNREEEPAADAAATSREPVCSRLTVKHRSRNPTLQDVAWRQDAGDPRHHPRSSRAARSHAYIAAAAILPGAARSKMQALAETNVVKYGRPGACSRAAG